MTKLLTIVVALTVFCIQVAVFILFLEIMVKYTDVDGAIAFLASFMMLVFFGVLSILITRGYDK